jgi:hypothetical protein
MTRRGWMAQVKHNINHTRRGMNEVFDSKIQKNGFKWEFLWNTHAIDMIYSRLLIIMMKHCRLNLSCAYTNKLWMKYSFVLLKILGFYSSSMPTFINDKTMKMQQRSLFCWALIPYPAFVLHMYITWTKIQVTSYTLHNVPCKAHGIYHTVCLY